MELTAPCMSGTGEERAAGSKEGKAEGQTWPLGTNRLPLGPSTAAAQQCCAGLCCATKAGQSLARWPGRSTARRLGGVKLIALIPLRGYHLDPGNYCAQFLAPISRQMLCGWEQMGEEQQDGGQQELGQAGANPRGKALGKAGAIGE